MPTKLYELPFEILLAVGAGYAAYYVANVGLRAHHKSVDVTFSTLVFGLLTLASYRGLIALDVGLVWSPVIAFLGTTALGCLWSLLGRRVLVWLLRASNVSQSNDLPTAWVETFNQEKNGWIVRQVSVKVRDGTVYDCVDVQKFEGAPNGPCIFGGTGDMLIYATHKTLPKGRTRRLEPDAGEWGLEATYIPASEIVRVTMRRSKRRAG